MTGGPQALCKVTGLRLLLERRRVSEALAALREAEQALAEGEAAVAASQVVHDRSNAEWRAKPGCEQRRFLLDVNAFRLEEAERIADDARARVFLAREELVAARNQERRAEARNDVVVERAGVLLRRERERQAEREGEDRWTPALTA